MTHYVKWWTDEQCQIGNSSYLCLIIMYLLTPTSATTTISCLEKIRDYFNNDNNYYYFNQTIYLIMTYRGPILYFNGYSSTIYLTLVLLLMSEIWDLYIYIYIYGCYTTWLSHLIVQENQSQMTNNKQAQMLSRQQLWIMFIVGRYLRLSKYIAVM